MENKFFEELSRRLREGGVESSNVEDRRLEIFLHGQPVLFVSPGHDAFLFAGRGVKTRRPVNCITGWQGWRMRYMSM